jgi:hypothetical protein
MEGHMMSRGVRPVALDWEHPRNPGTYSDGSPHYRPLHSREDLRRHLEDYAENPGDWEDGLPEPADYMPEIPEGTPYGWQYYETVTEGTPCSPVCATKEDLAAWLSSPEAGRERMSPDVAARFVAQGWAPSFVSTPQTGFIRGTEWVGRS